VTVAVEPAGPAAGKSVTLAACTGAGVSASVARHTGKGAVRCRSGGRRNPPTLVSGLVAAPWFALMAISTNAASTALGHT